LVAALKLLDSRAAPTVEKLGDTPEAIVLALTDLVVREAERASKREEEVRASIDKEERRWGPLDEDRSVYLWSLVTDARIAERRAREVATRLGELTAAELREALGDLLDNDRAMYLLGRIGDSGAASKLLELLRQAAQDGDTKSAVKIADSLTPLRETEPVVSSLAASELLELLRQAAQDGDTKSAEKIVHSLTSLRETEPVVSSLERSSPTLFRWYVAQLLGDIGDTSTTSALETLANDPDEGVREAALGALQRIQHRSTGAVAELGRADPETLFE
jgi:hypothetical protein